MIGLIVYSMRVSMPTLILLSDVVMLLEMCANTKDLLQFHYHFIYVKMEI